MIKRKVSRATAQLRKQTQELRKQKEKAEEITEKLKEKNEMLVFDNSKIGDRLRKERRDKFKIYKILQECSWYGDGDEQNIEKHSLKRLFKYCCRFF